MCRLKVNKVKYYFYYRTLWSQSIFALVKNTVFSVDVMPSQYSITNMILSRKEQITCCIPVRNV